MTAQTLDPPFSICVTEDTLFKAFEPYGLHLWTEAKSSDELGDFIQRGSDTQCVFQLLA